MAAVLLATGAMATVGAGAAEPAGPGQPVDPEPVNPAAVADARQHARQEIAALEAGAARRAQHLVRWLAVPAGALAGWLKARGRPRG
jgi:hypothetical protein